MHVELRIGFGPGEIVSYTRVRNIQFEKIFIFLFSFLLLGFLENQKIDIAKFVVLVQKTNRTRRAQTTSQK